MTDEKPDSDDTQEPVAPDPFAGPEWHASRGVGNAPERGGRSSRRVKVSRRRRRVLRRRRRLGLAMIVLGGLIVLAGAWIVITGLLARQQLNSVRAEVHQLRAQIGAGNLFAARATARDLADHARRAHELTTGPVWAVASGIPAGGEPLSTFRGVSAAVDRLGAEALPRLVSASQTLDPKKLRRPDGSFDLAPIAAVAPTLDRAASVVTAARASVQDLPESTWLSPVDTARHDVLTQLGSLGQTVRSADLAARVAPAMLGQDGPRRYLLAFQTEAELRGTGGLPGAFAIVQANRGKLSFLQFESDSALSRVRSGLDFGSAYRQLYAGANAPNDYGDSNVSPHFPYAAQIWTAMWRKHSGQHLDGAMALDPTALSYLLAVTGPASMPDKTQLTAANVVSRTQREVYAKFPLNDQAGRKKYQLQIAKAISRHLLDSRASATSLLRAAGRAAGERRLLAWSADPGVEAALAQTALGGVVPRTSAPYLGLSINNAAANKLDYYLDASLIWRRSRCGSRRDVTVTLTIRNDAPARVPANALGQTGKRGFPQHPGDNRLLVGYFATRGSQLTGIELDGRPSTARTGSELGHPVFTADVELPRGRTRTIVLHLKEPAGAGSPTVAPQPLVRPLKVKVGDANCK